MSGQYMRHAVIVIWSLSCSGVETVLTGFAGSWSLLPCLEFAYRLRLPQGDAVRKLNIGMFLVCCARLLACLCATAHVAAD
jgi:hypothetical protein